MGQTDWERRRYAGDVHGYAEDREERKVPNLKGLGLMDAIYAIENDGYRCLYSGIGHVVSQSPAAGSTLAAGEKITIRLE